jgi:hypothetical protein
LPFAKTGAADSRESVRADRRYLMMSPALG